MANSAELVDAWENQPYASAELRGKIPVNRFGLRGIDHLGMACRDPDKSGKFLERILGGVEAFRFGYSAKDRELGRFRHIFYHIGSQLIEVVENEDGTGYPERSDNSNPHWSFGATPQAMAKFIENLKAEGVPYDGPRSHNAASAVSVYFVDLDGNKLEVATWDPIPEGLMELTPMGGKYGLIKWSALAHNWEP